MFEENIIETEVSSNTIETESDSLIGTPGIDGVTFTPSVSQEGIISWTNNGGLSNPTPINIKGEKGEKGDKGDKGEQGDKGEPGKDSVEIIDNLTSTDTDKALSANMGKELNDKIDNEISAIEKTVNSVASGSPKGTYTNAAALKAANPDTGVYIATDNGHIYSWTKNQSGDPIDLGVYQATVIETDRTLSIAGDCADAKATGKRFDNKYTISGLTYTKDTAYSIMSNLYELPSKFAINVKPNAGYDVVISAYDNESTFVGNSSKIDTETLYPSISKYFKFRIIRKDGTNIELDEANQVEFTTKLFPDFMRNALIDKNNNEFTSLKERLDFINNENVMIIKFDEFGSLNIDGTVTKDTNNRRFYIHTTRFYELKNKNITLKVPDGYKLNLVFFDSDGNALNKETGWITEDRTLRIDYDKFKINSAKKVNYSFIDDGVYSAKIIINDYQLGWEQGSFNNGVKAESTIRIRTNDALVFGDNDTIRINCKNGYYIAVIPYDSEGNYSSTNDSGWVTDYILKKNDNLTYKLIARKSDNTDILPSEAANITISYSLDNDGIKLKHKIDFSTVRGFCHRCRTTIGQAPNTIEAMEASFLRGGKFMETDIRKSSDGIFVIRHDATIDSTSNGTGTIANMTFEQLRQYDYCYYSNGTKKLPYDHQVLIPSLDEMLLTAKKYDLILCMDMVLTNEYANSTYIRDVYNKVKEYGLVDNMVWHFNSTKGMRVLLGIDNTAIVIQGIDRIPNDYSSVLVLKSDKNQVGFTTQYTHYLPTASEQAECIETLESLTSEGLIAFAYTITNAILNDNPTLVDDLISYGFIGIGTDDVPVEPLNIIISQFV